MTKTEINSQHALDWAVIGWLSKPGTRVIWTTHGYVPARAAFERFQAVLEAIPGEGIFGDGPPIQRAYRTHGREEIRLLNGSQVIFMTRGPGSRGYSADKLILDQAYAVTEQQLAALLPVMVRGEVVYAESVKVAVIGRDWEVSVGMLGPLLMRHGV